MTCQKDKEKTGITDQTQAVTTITGEQQKCAKSEDHITISKEVVSQSYRFYSFPFGGQEVIMYH